MTDRIHSLTVTLTADLRDDDCQPLIDAIGHLRGVADVTTHVADLVTHMAQVRARRELGEKIWEVLYPKRSAP